MDKQGLGPIQLDSRVTAGSAGLPDGTATFKKTLNRVIKRVEEVSVTSTVKAYGDVHCLCLMMVVMARVGVLLGIVPDLVIIRWLSRQLGGESSYTAEITRRITADDLAMHVQTHPGDHNSILLIMA